MRPDVSDRQSRARGYRIRFDARNAEVLRVVSDELRSHPVASLALLSPQAKDRLRPLYQSLATALPNDPAAPQYLAMMDRSAGVPSNSAERLHALQAGARSVVQAVTDAAADNRLLPEKSGGGVTRSSGDDLTELYVRRAAAAARKLPPDVAAAAFLLGIGVALDDSTLVRNSPVVGEYWRHIEPDFARTTRVPLLGNPTMRQRHNSAQHFAVSAALAVLFGSGNAEAAGIGKEMSDARSGGSGFSFADYLADLAASTSPPRSATAASRSSACRTVFSSAIFCPI